jgi:hypothetical protein
MAGTGRQDRDSQPQSPQLEVVGSVLKKYLDIRARVSGAASWMVSLTRIRRVLNIGLTRWCAIVA